MYYFSSESEFRRWLEKNLDFFGIKQIILSQTYCPDYVLLMKDGRILKAEAELHSRNFKTHKHLTSKVDIIICGYTVENEVLGVPVLFVNKIEKQAKSQTSISIKNIKSHSNKFKQYNFPPSKDNFWLGGHPKTNPLIITDLLTDLALTNKILTHIKPTNNKEQIKIFEEDRKEFIERLEFLGVDFNPYKEIKEGYITEYTLKHV